MSGDISLKGVGHFLMSVFSGIEFLYGNVKLIHFLQDSSIFVVNTTQQILTGKGFDRAIPALVDKDLNSRFILNFWKWCDKKETDFPDQSLSFWKA